MYTQIETYQQQKSRHSEELNSFDGLFFAFSNEQLTEGLQKIKAEISDIVTIGMGGYIRKDQVKGFVGLMNRHKNEQKELKKNTKKLVNAIAYELANHEYCITCDVTDALNALDLTINSVDSAILKKAIKKHNKNCDY